MQVISPVGVVLWTAFVRDIRVRFGRQDTRKKWLVDRFRFVLGASWKFRGLVLNLVYAGAVLVW